MTPSNISSTVASAFGATGPSGPSIATEPRYGAAFVRREVEIRAVPTDALAPINIDVITSMATVLGALPGLRELRPTIAMLPAFDLAAFDALEDYTMALGATHSRWMIATAPREALPELGAAAVEVRDTLVADATALARRGVLDGQLVANFRSGVGYRAVVRDLMGLTALLRDAWDTVSRLTALEESELVAASNLADRIVGALGERALGPAHAAESTLVRQQAFTLWMNAYNQARRAVAYLRWDQGDADKIAPSVYAGRGSGPRPKADSGQPDAAAPPAASVTAATPSTPTEPAPVTEYGPPGTPNSSPFLS